MKEARLYISGSKVVLNEKEKPPEPDTSDMFLAYGPIRRIQEWEKGHIEVKNNYYDTGTGANWGIDIPNKWYQDFTPGQKCLHDNGTIIKLL
ncbi:hypothetical protein ES707_11009 [subsurface metagenome]